jgi:choline dehydrogenase-like flavoprotein
LNRLDCDVLVIGSGAAGGVLAATLAELTDCRVVLAEKGGYFGHEFFDQREWDMRVLYAGDGRRTTNDGAIPVRGGQCVGGGTTVNMALCFDPLPAVWESWRQLHGLTGFSFSPEASDHGIAGLNLSSCLSEVRQRLSVNPASDREINDNNRLFEAGCRALGLAVRRFDLNMRDCLGCGYCAEGCAYDRKQGTMITFVADALARGVQLVHHFAISRLELERRAGGWVATGASGRVRPTRPGSRPNSVPAGRLQVRARLVIVAAGAIEAPLLLLRSGHPDTRGRIGRGLVLHPTLPVVGIFTRPLENYRGISGTVYSDHFAASHGFFLESLFGHPVYGANVLPGFGPEHFELMLRLPTLAGLGVMLVDRSELVNRVEHTPQEPGFRIRYRLSEEGKERLRFGAQRAIELLLAAGAEEVVLTSEEPLRGLPRPRFRSPAEAQACADLRFTPHRTTLTSAHCQATVQMGEDPDTSGVNSRCESHAVRGLMVCDSSSFPSSCGVNPMLSIMTLARYQARRIAGELSRYGL